MVEDALSQRLNIPVFHDDQHGTAIIVAAALLNALHIQQKAITQVKLVCLGAGAAGIASLRLLVALGFAKESIWLVDRQGVVHHGRTDINRYKAEFARDTTERTLAEVMHNADAFIGVSGPNLVTPAMVANMAPRPVLFALSNPDAEIAPDIAKAARSDLIMATGRSDYPNQVNNALGFPYIFRGALDVRAKRINREMQIAAVHALCALAREEVPEQVLEAYGVAELSFGMNYIIPKPLDVRLRETVSAAVAKAAVASGVAQTGYPAWYPKY
ncbi:MAG: NADP-dependent malic oxidoreductase [Halothiobacillaceae bacterium]|nr:MAG: NADP-dependent malic oxidoreductase [Halothiobacillaceae bacterium]